MKIAQFAATQGTARSHLDDRTPLLCSSPILLRWVSKRAFTRLAIHSMHQFSPLRIRFLHRDRASGALESLNDPLGAIFFDKILQLCLVRLAPLLRVLVHRLNQWKSQVTSVLLSGAKDPQLYLLFETLQRRRVTAPSLNLDSRLMFLSPS
eukprot:8570156-Pyramimonas_sp.AAC.1